MRGRARESDGRGETNENGMAGKRRFEMVELAASVKTRGGVGWAGECL